jgi:hypothetical protein
MISVNESRAAYINVRYICNKLISSINITWIKYNNIIIESTDILNK